jgi:hypothetical protein
MTQRLATDAYEMDTFSPKSIIDAGTTAFATDTVSESVFARDSLFSTVQP